MQQIDWIRQTAEQEGTAKDVRSCDWEEQSEMKRREIMCLLAGCMLLLTPMQTRATNLLDILSIGTINTEISGVSGDKDTAEDTKNENTDNQDVEEDRKSVV